jgi:hypothetical protein
MVSIKDSLASIKDKDSSTSISNLVYGEQIYLESREWGMGNREWKERLSSFVVYAVHGVYLENRGLGSGVIDFKAIRVSAIHFRRVQNGEN